MWLRLRAATRRSARPAVGRCRSRRGHVAESRSALRRRCRGTSAPARRTEASQGRPEGHVTHARRRRHPCPAGRGTSDPPSGLRQGQDERSNHRAEISAEPPDDRLAGGRDCRPAVAPDAPARATPCGRRTLAGPRLRADERGRTAARAAERHAALQGAADRCEAARHAASRSATRVRRSCSLNV